MQIFLYRGESLENDQASFIRGIFIFLLTLSFRDTMNPKWVRVVKGTLLFIPLFNSVYSARHCSRIGAGKVKQTRSLYSRRERRTEEISKWFKLSVICLTLSRESQMVNIRLNIQGKKQFKRKNSLLSFLIKLLPGILKILPFYNILDCEATLLELAEESLRPLTLGRTRYR